MSTKQLKTEGRGVQILRWRVDGYPDKMSVLRNMLNIPANRYLP